MRADVLLRARVSPGLDVFGCPWISLDVLGCPWMSLDVRAGPPLLATLMLLQANALGH